MVMRCCSDGRRSTAAVILFFIILRTLAFHRSLAAPSEEAMPEQQAGAARMIVAKPSA
jgi:hypothetical protein